MVSIDNLDKTPPTRQNSASINSSCSMKFCQCEAGLFNCCTGAVCRHIWGLARFSHMDQDDRPSNPELQEPPSCLNCGAALHGPYCARCGQRHETHPLTVGHLLAEVAETLTHADSRLWRTMRLLLTKPGLLTADFLAGRRERYLPPIRLYLILSFLFFLVLALDSDSRTPVSLDMPEMPSAVNGCRKLVYHGPFADKVEPRLREACVRSVQDLGQGGERLSRNFVQSLPKAMFLLLPLFAAVLSLFYRRPRRLYAEHLLFLVHNHSAIFLALTLVTVVDPLLPASLSDSTLLIFLVWLVWYCYRGLRVFHGQSRLRTWAKLIPALLLYTLLALLVLTFTGIASMLSV